MNGYDLSRYFFEWATKNPEQNKPAVGILFFWIVEKANRQQWQNKIILSSSEGIHMIGIRSYPTFIKALEILEKNGFISFLERAKNQFTTNIVRLNAVIQDKANKQKKEDIKDPIPTYQEFKEYAVKKAKQMNLNIDLAQLEIKYNLWKENDWHNGHDKKITNWKTTLTNTLPYLVKEKAKTTTYNPPKNKGEISTTAFHKIIDQNNVLFSIEDAPEFNRHYNTITLKNDLSELSINDKKQIEDVTKRAYEWYCKRRAGNETNLIPILLKGCIKERQQLLKFYTIRKWLQIVKT